MLLGILKGRDFKIKFARVFQAIIFRNELDLLEWALSYLIYPPVLVSASQSSTRKKKEVKINKKNCKTTLSYFFITII